MKYKIVKETKPTLKTFGKYKAKAVHNGEVGSRHIRDEVSERLGISEGAVEAVMMCLSNVISHHLRRGDKVRLDTWGLMKLEIESDKVDDPTTFRANKHIRGVRLHFLPESEKGKPELYQDMTFEKERG
jgi:predicted histone-like DNA-binding protein